MKKTLTINPIVHLCFIANGGWMNGLKEFVINIKNLHWDNLIRE
jgi:hypothetical protein